MQDDAAHQPAALHADDGVTGTNSLDRLLGPVDHADHGAGRHAVAGDVGQLAVDEVVDAQVLGAPEVVAEQVADLVEDDGHDLLDRPLLDHLGVVVQPPPAVGGEGADGLGHRHQGDDRRREVRALVHDLEARRGQLEGNLRHVPTSLVGFHQV